MTGVSCLLSMWSLSHVKMCCHFRKEITLVWGGKGEAFDLGYRWVDHSQASTRRLSNAALRAQGLQSLVPSGCLTGYFSGSEKFSVTNRC